MTSKVLPLTMAQDGERVRVERLNGGHGLEKRLVEMGLNVGSEVLISHRQGNQMVVIRGGTRLALGAGVAQRVLVKCVGKGADDEGVDHDVARFKGWRFWPGGRL